MPSIIIPGQRGKPKPAPWSIDQDSVVADARPLWDGLVLCIPFWEGGGLWLDNIAEPGRSFPAIMSGNFDGADWGHDPKYGLYVHGQGSNYYAQGGYYPEMAGFSEMTIVVLKNYRNSVASSFGRVLNQSNGSTSDAWSYTISNVNNDYFRLDTGSVTNLEDGVSGLNVWRANACTYDGATKTIYRDGDDGIFVSRATQSDTGSVDDSGEDWSLFAHHGSPTARWVNTYIAFAAVWNRSLSLDELNEFGRDPYRMLQPAHRSRVFFVPAAPAAPPELSWASQPPIPPLPPPSPVSYG